MNNVNSKTIETERLVIRDDTDTFYEWELLPEVTKFFSIRDNQSREDVVRKYVADSDDPKARQFTICLKAGTPGIPEAGGRMIGRIVLADIEDEWKAEIWRIYIADTALRASEKKPCLP